MYVDEVYPYISNLASKTLVIIFIAMKVMKNKIKSALFLLALTSLSVLVTYALFALISWEYNPLNWGVYTRGFFGFFSASSLVLTIGLFYDDSK